jgi:hypothetical protein
MRLTPLLVRGYGLKLGRRRGFDVPSGKSPSASAMSKYILKGEPKFLTPAGVINLKWDPKTCETWVWMEHTDDFLSMLNQSRKEKDSINLHC